MIRINLLPARVSKKKVAGKQQLLLFGLVLVLGLIMNFAWATTRGAELRGREAKVKNTRDEIARLDKIIGEVKNIKDAQKALKEKLDVLDKLKAGRTGPVRMLDELATITPKRLWLKKMSEKDGQMSFEGSGATIDDVSEFMSALQKSQYFSSVELKKTSAKAEKEFRLVDFTLTATAKYNPLAAEEAAAAAKKGPGAPAGAAPAPAAAGAR